MVSQDYAIRVDGISKTYKLGGKKERYRTLRDSLTGFMSRTGRKRSEDTLWALKDVSFDVKPGEVLGVIGRNGAGKSTLLKILTRITDPTDGEAIIRGRVGSLLEVGTGFHPELSGRENIYLNGAILGIRRADVDRKFDEIVAFAEVERFIDTAVKHYSSGMYLRLAFAVAAHMEPEILLVDEVLAVGDAAFQAKCLGRMGEIAQEGRTVLLVSHHMPSIEALCNSAMVMVNGQVDFRGDTETAVSRYLSQTKASVAASQDLSNAIGRQLGSTPVFRSISVLDEHENPSAEFRMGASLIFELGLEIQDRRLRSPRIVVAIDDERGRRVCSFLTDHMVATPFELDGKHVIRCYWNECRLVPGKYRVKLNLKSHRDQIDAIDDAIAFEIFPADLYGTGKIPENNFGVFAPDGRWEIDPQRTPALTR